MQHPLADLFFHLTFTEQKQGACQLPMQLTSKGSPLSKYALNMTSTCWFRSTLKLGTMSKGRVACVAGLLCSQDYVTWRELQTQPEHLYLTVQDWTIHWHDTVPHRKHSPGVC